MLSFLGFLNEQKKGDTAATTFFHEVICGIACYDSRGASQIKTGEDIKKFFDDGTIIAVDSSLRKIDVMTTKQARFMSPDELPNPAIKRDAIAIAKKLVEPSRIGRARKPILWTGPTNEKSDYGAADIAFNGIGVSLKYGVGQLKNLTVGSFGRTVLGINEDILKVILREQSSAWDQMVRDWIELLTESIPVDKGQDEFIKSTNEINTWPEYQSERLDNDEQSYFDEIDNGYSKNHKNARELRYLARKYYETLKPRGWDEVRNQLMGTSFDNFFKDKDTTIRKNLASLFKAQISVGKNDLWYAAKGGKDIKLVPSEEKFNRGLENVRFDYRGETKGSGYTFTLVAHTIDKDIDVMKIQIVFRFKNGQMYGNPSTTSSYKMMVNDYTDIFGS